MNLLQEPFRFDRVIVDAKRKTAYVDACIGGMLLCDNMFATPKARCIASISRGVLSIIGLEWSVSFIGDEYISFITDARVTLAPDNDISVAGNITMLNCNVHEVISWYNLYRRSFGFHPDEAMQMAIDMRINWQDTHHVYVKGEGNHENRRRNQRVSCG